MVRISRKLLVTLVIFVSSVVRADANDIARPPLENPELAKIAAFTVKPNMATETRPSQILFKIDAKGAISFAGIENLISDVGLASVSQTGTTLAVRASLH